MKKILKTLGVCAFIIAGVNVYQWFTLDSASTTIMQQQMAGMYLVYSGIMFLAGIVGLLPIAFSENNSLDRKGESLGSNQNYKPMYPKK